MPRSGASVRLVKITGYADEQVVRLEQDAGDRGKLVDLQIINIHSADIPRVISELFGAAIALGIQIDYPPVPREPIKMQ